MKIKFWPLSKDSILDEMFMKHLMVAAASYSQKECHEWAAENFNSSRMADAYMARYEHVLNGETLNAAAPQLLEVQPKFLPWNPL